MKEIIIAKNTQVKMVTEEITQQIIKGERQFVINAPIGTLDTAHLILRSAQNRMIGTGEMLISPMPVKGIASDGQQVTHVPFEVVDTEE